MSPRSIRLVLLFLMITFVVGGGIRIGALGIPSEEVLPHLFSHPKVAAAQTIEKAEFLLEAPYDLPGGAERRGLVYSKVWPVLSVVEPPKSYPILAEAWQSAHLSYAAALLKPLLGGSIEGLRRTALLVGVLGLWLVALLAPRLSRKTDEEQWLGVMAAAWLGTSVGFLFIHRMAYLIETAPPLFAALVLYWVLENRSSRFILAGFAAGLALSMKITTSWVFLGFVPYLLISKRFPRQTLKVWLAAAASAVVVLLPLIIFFVHEKNAAIVGRSASFLSDPLRTVFRLPRTAWITATYLGHPNAILEPLLAGQKNITLSLWAPLLPLVVTGFSVFRVLRRPEDREPELLWLCVMPTVLVFAALLYASDNPMQIAFLIAPYYAIVVARAFYALYRVFSAKKGPMLGRVVLLLVAGSVQASEIFGFWAAHRIIGNPMFSMDAQREMVSTLISRGIESPLTTTYNSPGFYEFLSEGRIRPVHLYPLLLPEPGMAPERYREVSKRAWMIALLRMPGPVVMPLGYNVFEGGRQDPDIVRAAFFAACESLDVSAQESARFPKEGPPAFGLYEITGTPHAKEPIAPIVHQGEQNRQSSPQQNVVVETPAGSQTRALLGQLGPGSKLGDFIVEDITDPFEGGIFVHARSPSNVRTTFEVRLLSATPRPPAQSRGYAVYYRNPEGAVSQQALQEAALALAKQMDNAPADLPPPLGLTHHPAADQH